MIALLGSLLGFAGSWIPELMKIFTAKQDQKHELAIIQLQMQSAQADRDIRHEEIGAQADIAETTALYRTYSTGVKWVDAFNGTVRPALTYCFFILYATVKYLQYTVIGEHAPMFQYLDALWTPEDQAIFAGIISFYFGQRQINKGK